MANNQPIINTFEKGMYQDSLMFLQPPGTSRYMRNMTIGDRHAKGYGIATEESNKLLHDYGKKIVGAKYAESLDATIVFLEDGSIHMFDHTKNEDTFVAKDSEFGCNWGFQGCEWIRPDFKTDQPCNELKIYWSSGCDYYVVNLAEMLNRTRKEALKASITSVVKASCNPTCEYFRLMKCVCAPVITPVASENGGHALMSGTYQFAVQLADNYGNETNWSYIADPTSISSENNIPGEPSQSSIKVHITGLDCRYDMVRIAVIKSIDEVVTAEVVAERGYSTDGLTFIYTGQVGRDIDLKEIKAKRKHFIRGRELISKDSRLWLYGIRQEKNLNMQKRVIEEAQINFIEIETTPQMVEKYGLRTYERGESYLFGVVYNYCDGTSSVTFIAKPQAGSAPSPPTIGGINPPTGTAQDVTRPRGGASATGGTYGCPGGNCGGGGDGTTSEPRGSNPDEAGTGTAVSGWDTDVNDLVDAAKCDDCSEPFCCDENNEPIVAANSNCVGCAEDEEAIAADVPRIEDIVGNHTDEIADANQDNSPTYTNGTFKSAAEKLIESIDNSEVRVIKRDDFTILTNLGSGAGSGTHVDGNIDEPLVTEPGTTGNIEAKGSIPSNTAASGTKNISQWSDEFTDAKGNHLIDSVPTKIKTVAPIPKASTEIYPDTKDCNGVNYYGAFANTPVQLYKVPHADVLPIVIPTLSGVPSKDSTVDPIYSVKIRLIGIEATNIPVPNAADLPKPLCPNNPYSIVMVPRDEANSTVQAKGVFSGTFVGMSNDKEVTFVRHGANSRTLVDRWVNDGGSRKGSGDGPGYAFYGLDTAIGGAALSGGKVISENIYRGQGYRYGLYEKGEEPTNGLSGRRLDQRGARQYININRPSPSFGSFDTDSVGYVKANTLAEVPGATNPVSAMHRESFVYVQPSSKFAGATDDSSFTTDTLNHNCPVPDAFLHYGCIFREIEDQYGSITNLSFIKTGLEGRSFGKTYQAISGDTFIGPYSFVKKGYVSDKVGNTYPTPERDRTVCDSPNDSLLQTLGMDWYATQLPLSGDRSDAKNWAGGHRDKVWSAAYPSAPETDIYYPKLVKTLITTWVESRINPWYRATGRGADQRDAGQVFYPKLKNLHLDSASSSDRHRWTESFLNRFYYGVMQPSVAQLTRKALIKNIIYFILPMLGLTVGLDVETVPEAVKSILVSPILIAYWYALKKLITREDYLDKMLGLPVCKTDATGGESDNYIEQFEDNYHSYNYDHSRLNTQNIFNSMPVPYNTCSCDDCLSNQTTNEIYYSNKQVQGSTIDFYKQFGALSYLNISADNGKLTNLFVQNGDFYAHTTDGILPIKYKDYGETSAGMSRLGGDLIADPTILLEGVTEGFAGLTDQNSAINTVFGYAWIDRPSRKFYLFDGRNPQAVSTVSLDKLFREHLDFCELSSCHDEKVESGTYYSLGYDPVFSRILITKKDLKKEHSFTIGVVMGGEMPAWDGFHDYIPQSYFWDRANMYTTKEGKIYLQNANDGTYRTFYEEEFPSEIEFVALTNTEWFTYIDTEINSEAEKDQRKNLDDTFNRIAIYNATQGTGTLPAVVSGDNRGGTLGVADANTDKYRIILNKVKRIFRFNNVKDFVKKDCKEQALTIKDKCEPITKINEAVFDCSALGRQQQYDGRTLNDDHIVYRMSYDKDNKTLLRLLSVKTNYDNEER